MTEDLTPQMIEVWCVPTVQPPGAWSPHQCPDCKGTEKRIRLETPTEAYARIIRQRDAANEDRCSGCNGAHGAVRICGGCEETEDDCCCNNLTGAIDPKRFPQEHDWVGASGKGRKCKQPDADGVRCGAKWGWHYWPWDSRGDCC